jgi:hypothetical protein
LYVESPFKRWALAVAIVLLAAGTLLAYAGVATAVAFAVVAAGGFLLWWADRRRLVLGYAATLAVQVFQSLVVFRVAVSDLFMLPAAAKSVWHLHLSGDGLPYSSLTPAFVVLLAAFTIANIVAVAENGSLSGYAIVNKDLGILYLIVGYYTVLHFLSDRSKVEQLARTFVIGVSCANAAALVAVVLALSGLQNDLYLVGNSRLYGWMLNPSLFGGVIMAVAMLELGQLTAPADRPTSPWRWVNVGLLGVSVALTISRGIWLATTIAASALFVVQIAVLPRRPHPAALAATLAWALVPAAALMSIVSLNPGSLVMPIAEERAAELQSHLVGQCRVNPDLDVCPDVEMPAEGSTPITSASPAPPEPAVPPPVVDNAMTNARGLQDRVAILQVGFRDYSSTVRRQMLGIGLGTFYATSAHEFGVPLIIHNTFAWFLIEMGPLGLLAVLWIWVQTSFNLFNACRARDWRLPLAIGVCAAFCGMSVFCVLNEGFYQRHLWLVIALADRLGAGRHALGSTPQSPEAVAVQV